MTADKQPVGFDTNSSVKAGSEAHRFMHKASESAAMPLSLPERLSPKMSPKTQLPPAFLRFPSKPWPSTHKPAAFRPVRAAKETKKEEPKLFFFYRVPMPEW